MKAHQRDLDRVVGSGDEAAQDDGRGRGGVPVAPCPGGAQAAAHGLHAGAHVQARAIQHEREARAGVVECGAVGLAVLGARVGGRRHLLLVVAQVAALAPRLARARQAPLGRPRHAHLWRRGRG